MKFNFKLMLLSFAALAFGACSDDIGNGNGADIAAEDGDIRFIKATIALPSQPGGRSGTQDPDDPNYGDTNSDAVPDYEIGHDYENDVRSMILVIATPDDEYITHITLVGNSVAVKSEAENLFTATAKIPYAVLEQAYGSAGLITEVEDPEAPAPQVRLYAYCNFTQDLLHEFEAIKDDIGNTSWVDFYGTVEEKASMAGETPVTQSSIWSRRSFLMTNASVYTADFPRTLGEWDDYADTNSPLDLTTREKNNGGQKISVSEPIDVERIAARIDFRDASEEGDQVYPITINIGLLKGSGSVANSEPGTSPSISSSRAGADDLKNLFSVKLERMVLVNMSKNFYYLRRVSADGTATGREIGGKEVKNNYVVDFDHEQKAGGLITASNASQYFNFPLYDENGSLSEIQEHVQYNNVGSTYGWYVKDITGNSGNSVLEGEKDNWNGQFGNGNQETESGKGYHIWRYITENTIPGIENQKTVQSTGIIFKASILPGDDIDLKRDLTYDENNEADDDDRFVTNAVKKALEGVKTSENGKYQGSEEKLPALYSFQNMLYAGVNDIVAAAHRDGNGGSLYLAVDRILNNWYLEIDESEVEDQSGISASDEPTMHAGSDETRYFVYKDPSDFVFDIKTGKGYSKKEGEGSKPVYYKQLNVIVADEILNDFQPEDGSTNYSPSYSEENESDKYDIVFKRVFTGENAKDEEDAYKLKDLDNSQFIELAPLQQITVFIPTNDDNEGWGYYCYYFYWLRHFDNGLDGKMGPMEFASVRNNVYKLAVTDISKIGHPRDVDRDPDPIKPDDPDEKEENSIRIYVEVRPWVVRVNDIELDY